MDWPMTPVPIQPSRVFDGLMGSEGAIKCRRSVMMQVWEWRVVFTFHPSPPFPKSLFVFAAR